MAELQDLLRYLEREDIDAVILQTESNISIEQAGQLRRLTRTPLSGPQLTAILANTPLQSLVPTQDSNGAPQTVQLHGNDYLVQIARRGHLLRVRITRAQAGAKPQAASSGGLGVGAAPGASQAQPVSSPQITRNADLHAPSPQAVPPQTASAQPSAAARGPAISAPEISRAAMPGGTSAQLEQLLRTARAKEASDLHLTSNRAAQIRVCGQLQPFTDSIKHEQIERMLLPYLKHHQAQLDELGYADFAIDVAGAGRLRANVCRHRYGIKGCFRLVFPEPPTIEGLGLPEDLMRITLQHQGLVVVAGPNGQGKTTTMNALIDWFNTNKSVHIITVEDPVEIVHPVKRALVSQREVGNSTKSFHSALKGSLREDPDIIAIGELRDRETVEMALSAAETGHLVLATMSTPSGAKTIDRLIELFPPDDQAQVRATMAGALKFVVSQRLVPSVRGDRMHAAVELITGNIPLWKLIRDNKLYQLPSLLQRGRSYGMLRIEDSLSDLMRKGAISVETARAFAEDPRVLEGGSLASKQPSAPSLGGSAEPPGAPEDKRGQGGLRGLFRRKED